MNYISTIIVLFVVILFVGFIIYKMYKDKKAGKSACGCKCSGCPNSSLCHSSSDTKKQ